jgi:hypothetical protein
MDTISKYFPAVQENHGHNSLYFQNTNMEADCKDSPDVSTPLESPDLQSMFTLLSVTVASHISSQTVIIQDQIKENDAQVQHLQLIFQQEVRSELDEFRELLSQQQCWLESRLIDPVAQTTPVVPTAPTLTTPVPQASQVLPDNSSSSSLDLQAQMLLMLTDSFSKLSSALTE